MSFYTYEWFNRPENISALAENKLSFKTAKETDFWQSKDNGHFIIRLHALTYCY